MDVVHVPVAWVNDAGRSRPDLCARHGEPSVAVRKVEFRRPLPHWAWVALVPTVLVLALLMRKAWMLVVPVALVLVAAERRLAPRTTVAAWPFCARCAALARLRIAGVVVGTVGVVAAVLAAVRFVTDGLDGTTLTLLSAGCAVMVAGALLRDRYSWRTIAGGRVAKDRRSIEVVAHDRFAAAVRDRFTAGRPTARRVR